MPTNRAGLLAAFDGAIAAVRCLEATDLRTSSGARAQALLMRLRDDLEARRGEIAQGAAFDRQWAGRVVRWVAEWIPEPELPLIARLGQIIRVGAGG